METFAKTHNASGYVLGVVGNLSRAAFQCPGQAEPTVLRVISRSSPFRVIVPRMVLTCTRVFLMVPASLGGHLEPGTLVLKGLTCWWGCWINPCLRHPPA